MIDISKYDEIIIWGASFAQGMVEGDATSHGRAIESLKCLLEENGYWDRVYGIVDSKKELHGMKRLEKTVYDPQILREHSEALIIVNTISIKAIQKAMDNMKIKNDYLIVPYYFYHGTLDNYYRNEDALQDINRNEDKIRNLYYMDDEHTKRYIDIICSMRHKNHDDLYDASYYAGTGENLNYFCDPVIAPHGDVTYIDVGAYDGNSIEPVLDFYGEKVKKIIAFEPDEKSEAKLEIYLEKRNIKGKTSVFPYALGSEERKIRFSKSGLFSIVSEEGEEALEQKIFDQIPNIDYEGDVMVKMDIEGAELDALKGMGKLLKEKEPYLAICLYHKVEDLFEIANYIKQIVPTYRLYIRGGGTSNVGLYRNGTLSERRAA